LPLRLNLASGTDIKPPPWVNLDVVPQWPGARPCDILWDARTDKIPFPDDSADEVYAGYLFLHLLRRYHEPVLAEIRRVLKSGSILRVGEVDMERVFQRYLNEDGEDPRLDQLIWGEQGVIHGAVLSEFDTHVQGFTEDTLRALLNRGGFKDLRRVQIHHPDVWYELTLECTK
jgi:predicted SAM-dependent methyltransferase